MTTTPEQAPAASASHSHSSVTKTAQRPAPADLCTPPPLLESNHSAALTTHTQPHTSAAMTVPEQHQQEKPPAPTPLGTRINRKWIATMDAVREAVSYGILVVTNHAACHPISYIVGVCVLSFGLVGVGLLTNFDMSARSDESYTPEHSFIREQMHWITQESGYPTKPHSLRIMIHQKGDNVLTPEGVNKTFAVSERVQQTQRYASFCEEAEETNAFGFGGLCHIRGMPLLWNHSQALFNEGVSSKVDLLLQVSVDKFPDGSDMDPRELMGHFEYLDGTLAGRKIIETAETFLMEVVVPAQLENSKGLAIDVLEELLDLRKEWGKNPDDNYQLELFLVDHSLETETLRAVFYDLPLIPTVFVVMTLFTCIVFSTSHKSGKTWQPRFMLGFGAVATILMSLAASHGLLFIIGVPFTSLTQTLPFVMFGIGLDDAFIIYGEFIRTNEKDDPVDRIHPTFEEVGLSIFVTKVTTALAFALGCLGSVPALTWLSLYAFPTVIILFVFQLTFFVAIVVVDEGRINAAKRQKRKKEGHSNNNHSGVEDQALVPVDEDPVAVVKQLTTDKAEPETVDSESQSTLNSGDNTANPPPEQAGPSAISALERQPSVSGIYHHHIPAEPASGMDRWMRRYADFLLTRPVKIFVLIGFVALTVGLSFSATNFRQEFNIYEILRSDSYLAAYFRNLNSYADTGFGLAKAYFRNVDHSDPDVREQMQQYVDEMVGIDAITRQPPYFWLNHFNEFLTYDDRLLDLTFNQQMDIFLSIDHFKTLYGDHIVRDEESGDIITSRVQIFLDNIDVGSVINQIQVFTDQLAVTESQPINAEEHLMEGFGYNFFLNDEELLYSYELYSVFAPELTSSSILGVLVVSLVTFLFLPHWSATLFLTPIISILLIELIGFLAMCGVPLNAISYFALVMSIGLLVDFNMHILMRYYESPCTTRDDKVKDALSTMGSSVVIGGFSTWLGVCPLLFSSSSLMKSLFFAFWGMVILGCGHGVIVLPVILSYVGPIKTYTLQRPSIAAAIAASKASASFSGESTKLLQDTPGASTPGASTCHTAPSSDSSTRPHLESDGDLSGISEKQTLCQPKQPQQLDPMGNISEASESSELESPTAAAVAIPDAIGSEQFKVAPGAATSQDLPDLPCPSSDISEIQI